MRLLFDTQLWIWFATDRRQLPVAALNMLSDPGNDVSWSTVSVWEVSIKFGLGRPDFAVPPGEILSVLRQTPFTELPVFADHVLPIAELPPIHKDPFDRILIAQALTEDMTFVTADRKLPSYPGLIRLV
ncbi:MAG: type II toxin-antitoxin system VapC family toxin [Gemmobacter sp.]